MTIDEMIQKNYELGYSYEEIAQLSGLPRETVREVFDGITKPPGYDIVKALEKVFAQPGREEDPDITKTNFFCEAAPYMEGSSAEKITRKKQGEYTLEDYYALPDEMRAELIDGVFYNMASPTSIHQVIAFEIAKRFSAYIEKNNGKCISMISPLDVQLHKDDKTVVQPDVMIICDRSKIKRRVVCGAPDLVVEVLSPSTLKKDMRLKLKKYYEAGVREYWIADPDDHAVTVYKFGDNIDFKIYEDGETIVPVGIFDDQCIVDFGEIFNLASEFEDE